MNFKPKFVRKGKQAGSPGSYESVTKYMATDLVTFFPDTEIIEAIDVMLQKRISGAPVLDHNKKLVGLISEKDCLKVMIDSVYHNQPVSRSRVSQYMTSKLHTLSSEADVVDAANEFLKTKFKRFPVIDDQGRLVGQISRRDVLRAIKEMNITNWQKELV